MTFTTLALVAMSSVICTAGTPGQDNIRVGPSSGTSVLVAHGLSEAKSDTITLLGGPLRNDGKFQVDGNPTLPDFEGWVGVDKTAHTTTKWHIDTFNSPTGTAAAWCGEIFATCGDDDPPEGYGDNYEEYLDWTGTVADNGITTNVTVTFDLNFDNEPGYDYLYMQCERAGGMNTIKTYNGSTLVGGVWVPLIDETVAFSVASSDLVGDGEDEIHLRLRAISDGAWSDSDCLWPTSGLAQIDNISVSGDNGLASTFDDFESGLDGANWTVAYPVSYGNFTQVWPLLDDVDPCVQNDTPQVAFIDDGIVVPCTGGTLGTTWTYGPGGYVVNSSGGCAGPATRGWNEIWSPVIAWADPATGIELGRTHRGAQLEFGVWTHLPIANGIFSVWHVRSSNDHGTTWTGWEDRNFVYYGPPVYERKVHDVTDLVVSEPTHVQIALGFIQFGWFWWPHDSTPAPYFDNVRFDVFALDGPTITAYVDLLSQDAFPASGVLDHFDLSANSIRFDAALDIVGDAAPAIVPGDSLVCSVVSHRPGAVLTQPPRLYYAMKPNHLFDPHRTHPTSGWAVGDTVRTATGDVVPNQWAFDLPDEGFFFPGDVIHYLFHAEDDVGGDIEATTLPSSSIGFDVFPGDPDYDPLLWPAEFTVRGLPTMNGSMPGDQPDVLLWDDGGARSDDDRWEPIMAELGYQLGVHYDLFRTQAATSGVSNGLGAKATVDQISGYSTILYTLGDLTSRGLNGFNLSGDKSNDIALLNDWLSLGRNLLVSGDNTVDDLRWKIGGAAFISEWLSAAFVARDVEDLIDGQATPLVLPTLGNPGGFTLPFTVDGGCPDRRTFDAIEPTGNAVALAEWADPSGLGGVYPYAAALAHETAGSRVVTLPADLSVWDDQDGGTVSRLHALVSLLSWFGEAVPGGSTEVDQTPRILAARAHPNPFNPRTTVVFDVPRRGRVTVTVFDVRGRLVRKLADEMYESGAAYEATWDGLDSLDRSTATGAYFVVVRAGREKVVEKIMLVR